MDTLSDIPSTSISLLASEVYEPTSTLEYVNAQLVSHGFARSPGLSLDGLANQDSERLVKCLLGLLNQRVEDMGRTEELSSKLRTLTYEHERLQSMHRTEVDASANAEREMHQFKSKLATSQKALATETAAHKQTLGELQRTRTSLQYLRSTTQNELKRKDKEVERIMERWNKVADTQAKLLVTQSGLRCANLAAGATESARGMGLMELALQQAEEARGELVKENDAFRSVLLSAANALQGTIHTAHVLVDPQAEETVPLSHPVLFAPPTSVLSQPENAHAKLRELFAAFRDVISNISTTPPSTSSTSQSAAEDEIKKLNELVTSLRAELKQSRQSSTSLATQSQELLDRFTTYASERFISGRDPTPKEAAEMSMELMGVPEQDEVRAKLESRAAKLEKERERFTEAAIKLGKEKAELQAERMKMIEEKRRWAVEQMLAELPPTPGPDPDLASPPKPTKVKLKAISPSPPRVRQRKASGSRRSLSPLKKGATKRVQEGLTIDNPIPRGGGKKLKERRQSGVFGTLEVLYEPEESNPVADKRQYGDVGLQRSTTPEDSPPVAALGSVAAEMKASLPLVLPTTFTLPPPSPASSFTALDLASVPSQSSAPQQGTSSAIPSFDAIPLARAPPVVSPFPRSRTFPSPRTPRLQLNPLVKHAYSPVRPSPLSRILMLADSPPSPPSVPPIDERPEEEGSTPPPRPNALPKRMLVQGLRVPLDEPSPLRELPGGNANPNAGADGQQAEGNKRLTAKEKGKGRAVSATSEKENVGVLGGSKPKVVSSGVGASNLKGKVLKAAVPETKKPAGVRPTLKPSVQKDVPPRRVVSGGNAGPTTAPVNAGGSVVMKPGGARRVPLGGAGKMGVRRV